MKYLKFLEDNKIFVSILFFVEVIVLLLGFVMKDFTFSSVANSIYIMCLLSWLYALIKQTEKRTS